MTVHHRDTADRRSRSTTSAPPKTSSPRSTRPSSTSTTATSSKAPSSRSTATRSCSTSATRPRASSPRASCPSSTTSTPTRSSSVGDEVEALVLQKEDKEGRLILSKKRAQYERAWGTIEKIKEEDGVVTGTVIEVVKGGLILDIGLRGFLPASLVEMRRVRDLQPYVGKELEAKIIELDKNRNNVVLSRRAWLEQTQSEVRTTFLTGAAEGPGPHRRRVLDRQLRCVRRPRRRRRSRARLRAVLEAHRPPVRGRRGRPGGHGRGARRRHGPRARLAVAQGDAGRPVAALRPHPRDRSGRARQGHQARAVRCVRARRRRHRGPGPHLRAGRAPRRAAGAGRHGRRRHLRQGHRHRPRASPHLAVAEAGQRGHLGVDDERVRPDALRHGRRVRRAGQLQVPRGLRPGDQRVAARATRPLRPSGRSSTPRRTPAGRRTEAGREPRKADAEAGVADGRRVAALVLHLSRPRRPRAPSRPTRRCRRCATSSPAPDRTRTIPTAPDPTVRGRRDRGYASCTTSGSGEMASDTIPTEEQSLVALAPSAASARAAISSPWWRSSS